MYHKNQARITCGQQRALKGNSSERDIPIGTTTKYLIGKNANIVAISSLGGDSYIEIDSVSSRRSRMANSTNLYNYVYANTTGTAEQKEYAAVKAAAMWCHNNNDPAIGAIYGKLYNWYAVRLLQMDIDYYNAANPTAPWGWKVSAKILISDVLIAYLGGADIAGGKDEKRA